MSRAGLVTLVAVFGFVVSVAMSDRYPVRDSSLEMAVKLPRFVQVIMAGGDRYLAANIGAVRALVSDTNRLDPQGYEILAQVQDDVSWLNPAHEDNYYISTAILPWNGHVDVSQTILKRAAEARPFDFWPAFYYAFGLYHFKKDAVQAVEWLRLGADRAKDEQDSLLLSDLASRWLRRGADRKTAISMLSAMATTTRSGGFAAYLRKHVKRLENLMVIENAGVEYTKSHGAVPQRLETLFVGGEIPVDPFGMVYAIDANGKAYVKEGK